MNDLMLDIQQLIGVVLDRVAIKSEDVLSEHDANALVETLQGTNVTDSFFWITFGVSTNEVLQRASGTNCECMWIELSLLITLCFACTWVYYVYKNL